MDKSTDSFIFCSREVIQDGRLTLVQIKVLLALYSFRNKNTSLCFPSREAISKRTGIRVSRVSTTTTQLEELGWLKKFWDAETKHFSYRITVPDLGTVPESGTVPDLGTKGVPGSGTKGVPESGTHNYKDNFKDNLIIPEWLEAETWDEFKKHRKKIKKPMTEFAEKKMLLKLDGLRKDGHDPTQLLDTAIMNGWQGIVVPDKGKVIQAQTKFPSKFERDMETSSHLKRSLENERKREIDNGGVTGIQ